MVLVKFSKKIYQIFKFHFLKKHIVGLINKKIEVKI